MRTTAMTRWTPAGELFRDRFDRVFNDMLGDVFAPFVSEDVADRRWTPAVDVRESGDALTLTVELPGLRKEDVQITLENNILSLSGERKFEKETKEENYHRIERAYGSFSRSFTLPANVKADQVAATFQDGLLTISLPKVEEAKPRKVDIR